MNESSRTNTVEAINALVNSLESHEGTLTDRERQLCTTLLYGLAAAGQLRITTPVPGGAASELPAYNFETASEAERWAFDQGYENGWDARVDPTTMDLSAIEDELQVCAEALQRIRGEQDAQGGSRGRIEFADAVIELTEE